MPAKYEDKYVICPYYHTNEMQKMKCDGVMGTIATHLIFESDAQKKKYMVKYCCREWKCCYYARMLEMMWEENPEWTTM